MTPYGAFAACIDRLTEPTVLDGGVVPWACPVPYFGRPDAARMATVGINPSIREFTTPAGNELTGGLRRLPTLGSLRLTSWKHADATHVKVIAEACEEYFLRSPYDRWFKVLDSVLAHSQCTYYGDVPTACHLDLVPFATTSKWGDLSGRQRQQLLVAGSGLLAAQLARAPVQMLILNGRTVIDHFAAVSNVEFLETVVDAWRLEAGDWTVPGVAYAGVATEIGGVVLDEAVTVVGFNHNLQSSFGVTRTAMRAIGEWISRAADEAFG